MPRKSAPPSFPFRALFKKSSVTTLVAILSYLIYELIAHGQHAAAPAPEQVRLPASNEAVQLYSNQTNDDLTNLYLSAIQSAKKSITFVIYALMDPQIIAALQQKSEEGVPVYIVCDAKASMGISRKLPKATIVRRIGQGLMHQKILIIDETQILLGSANMTTDSLRVHGNLVMGIENPALAQAMTAKAKSMDEEGHSTPLPHIETQAGPQKVELWMLPDDPQAAKRVIELLRSAKKTIRVAMFTWTRTDFTQELIDAAKRGVQVEAVIDRYSGKGASAKIVRMLDQAGISVRLSTGHGLLHHKFAYIDGNILINGSANWTNNAFKNNDDYFVVLYPLTTEQQTKMNQLWQTIQRQSEKPGNAPKDGSKKKKEKVPYFE
ncbi:phospholipase D-like domain-containing protein [Candidatus Protochlamydia phocaeensis]|uniref:phospholipase D-like domain-containing protein n=1 Tax=Candidatus Protochlamydia phocaeensis TaxID=1414722 RepID=UPI0008391C50|nr:phospholipase D-like domain-containing protein [Candidatus Protochlamydia phocaeensis]